MITHNVRGDAMERIKEIYRDQMPLIDLTHANSKWSSFTFPDSQPHIAVSYCLGPLILAARVACSDDLIRLLMAQNILQYNGRNTVHLKLAYIMGGRMDRPMPIDTLGREQPFTLKIIADCIRAARFASIIVFDPHSDVTPALLNARPVLPIAHVRNVLSMLPQGTALVAPDTGAMKRVDLIGERLGLSVTHAAKKRDQATGSLSGFTLLDTHKTKIRGHYLIVDDLCDGGRTFEGIAEALMYDGADKVHLYVSHGIFSRPDRPFDLHHIDQIFTTDSYRELHEVPPHVKVLSWIDGRTLASNSGGTYGGTL